MAQWQALTADEARAHQLYGFKGWLIAVYALALVLFVLNVRSITGGDAMMLIMFETEPQVAFMRWVIALQCLAVLPFLLLAPFKHPLMPIAALVGFAIDALARPVTAALLININNTKVMAITGTHLLLGAIFISYLLLSRRVNVTYRNCIKAA